LLSLWVTNRNPGEGAMITEREICLVRHIARKLAIGGRANSAYDDLVGMGFIGLVEASHRFDPSRGLAFSTLASIQIRGRMIDLLRKQRRWYGRADWSAGSRPPQGFVENDGVALNRTCKIADAAMPVYEPTPSLESLIAEKEIFDHVVAAIDELPGYEARVIRARYLEGLSTKDIAAELGRSVRSINTIARRGVERLRKRLLMLRRELSMAS
jgi:RNA polymerase sigma factor (sigma-70 family)